LIFNDHLRKYTDYTFNEDEQTEALQAIKTLLQKINKDYSNILKMKLISVELVKD
jgi:hypothetical protein